MRLRRWVTNTVAAEKLDDFLNSMECEGWQLFTLQMNAWAYIKAATARDAVIKSYIVVQYRDVE